MKLKNISSVARRETTYECEHACSENVDYTRDYWLCKKSSLTWPDPFSRRLLLLNKDDKRPREKGAGAYTASDNALPK